MNGSAFGHATKSKASNVSWAVAAGLIAVVLLSAVSCRSPRSTAAYRGEATAEPYGVHPTLRWREGELAKVRATIPKVPNAEMVGDDQLCASCHETYVKLHHSNIHHNQSCESCHGPGSEHMRTRGKEPGLILSFKAMTAAERSETCLQCHAENGCEPGEMWRSSAHANAGVSCTDCHTGHYNVPPGTKPTDLAQSGRYDSQIQLARLPDVREEPLPSGAEQATASAPAVVNADGVQAEPLVAEAAAMRADSRSLGAITPQICYRCHANMKPQQHLAHPHQICGAAQMDCTTCHDPHGKIRPETRTDLCLKCHDMSSPTMAWHSSTHARYGVACADCHNPHPNTSVQLAVHIEHTHIDRKQRLPMSVCDPEVCYKCHQDIYAKNAMPSHHPIKEGKMVCADCHDPHGQTEDNLKEPTVNMVCYRCHAEKQGPFAFEHPPVTEDCGICHDPHGAVTKDLLHQPTTFLCLRCHTGHRTGPPPGGPDHGPLMHDVGMSPALQAAFYTDCTQCHSEIHGSDLPTPHLPKAFMR